MINALDIMDLLLLQDGDEYIFGHEVSLSDTNPHAFDCSELIQWGCYQKGVKPTMPDGSWLQARHCKDHGTMVPISTALETPGALLFRFQGGDPFTGGRPPSSHVAMSQGAGLTIEARSTKLGVGQFDSDQSKRGWTHAALIPGVAYTPRFDPPSSWAAEAWRKASIGKITTVYSDPHANATIEQVMTYFDRLGLI